LQEGYFGEETWNDSGAHSRQTPQPAEVDLDSLLALNTALTPPPSEPAEEHSDLLELATRSASAMQGIVLDAEMFSSTHPG